MMVIVLRCTNTLHWLPPMQHALDTPSSGTARTWCSTIVTQNSAMQSLMHDTVRNAASDISRHPKPRAHACWLTYPPCAELAACQWVDGGYACTRAGGHRLFSWQLTVAKVGEVGSIDMSNSTLTGASVAVQPPTTHACAAT